MKKLIQKWLGIDVLEDMLPVLLFLADEKQLQKDNQEWETLKKELEKAEKTGANGMVGLMVTSGFYYKDKIARYIELSDKLKKYKD